LFRYIIGEHDDLLSSTTAKEINRYLEDAIVHSRSENEMRLKLTQLEHFYELSAHEEEEK